MFDSQRWSRKVQKLVQACGTVSEDDVLMLVETAWEEGYEAGKEDEWGKHREASEED
jgi:hypothetical protein